MYRKTVKMFSIKLVILALSIALSGIFSPALLIAGEVQKSPLTSEEISVLQQVGGTQIQDLVRGDSEAIAKLASKAGVTPEKVKEALANLSDEDRQTLLSVSPAALDTIVAGEMDAGEIFVSALVAIGILFLVLLIAAS